MSRFAEKLNHTPSQLPAKRYSLAFLVAVSFHLLVGVIIFISALQSKPEEDIPLVDNAVIINAMAVQEPSKILTPMSVPESATDNTASIENTLTSDNKAPDPIQEAQNHSSDQRVKDEKNRQAVENQKREAALALAAQENVKRDLELKLAAEKKAKEYADQKLAVEQKAKLEAELKAKHEAEQKAKLEAELKAKHEAEQKAKREAELKLAGEQKAKAEAELKLANEQKAKLAADKAAEQEAFKKHLDEENEKKLAIKRKIEEFARQKREADQARLKQENEKIEADKAQQQAAVARSAIVSKTIDKYKSMILDAIGRQWIPPASADKTQQAKLLVRVASNGTVLSVTILRPSGNEALDRSAEFAVYKASPLPVPEDPEAFLPFQNLHLTVRKEGVLS